MNRTKVIYDHEKTTHIVTTNGELVSSEVKNEIITRRSSEPDYIKLYLDHLSCFKGVQKAFSPILIEFAKYMTYANSSIGAQIIYVNKSLKEVVAQNCNVSLSRVNCAITEFVKAGYLKRVNIGAYQINPFFFGKGDWRDIKNIRATFDYGTGEIVAEFIKHEEPQEATTDGQNNPN